MYLDADSLRVWRWAGPGELEELRLTCVEAPAFDADDYAYPLWAALGADGTAHVSVAVSIDGRA